MFSNNYDDAKYGVIERHWFGLPKTWGGGAAAGLTFNESEATPIKRFYPKGPIVVEKLGVVALATLGKGEQAFNLKIDGSTTMKSVVCSSASAPGAIASIAVNDSLTAGSYLSLVASTNACSTGTCAVFIDFRRKYETTGKWDQTDTDQ